MTDPFGIDPKRAQWCPECNGYGSSLKQETAKCTRCGGSGLVAIPDAETGAGRRRRRLAAPARSGRRRRARDDEIVPGTCLPLRRCGVFFFFFAQTRRAHSAASSCFLQRRRSRALSAFLLAVSLLGLQSRQPARLCAGRLRLCCHRCRLLRLGFGGG